MFRSLLFIPGNNPSMIQNADIFPADGIIFDLEDSVDVSEKDNARNLVMNYLNAGSNYPSLIVLRINPVQSEFIEQDLELLQTNKIDYILLPKADLESLGILDQHLVKYENSTNSNKIKVIALIESARSIIEANEIGAHERVIGLLLGAEDLSSELEIDRSNTGEEILFARSKIIYAAAANGIISIDTPNTSINNDDLLEVDCLNAKRLGMKAKTAIHPNQLELINTIFSPSRNEIHWAQTVLKEKENNKGKGAFSVQGKMIDKPLIQKAETIIQKAKKYKLL